MRKLMVGLLFWALTGPLQAGSLTADWWFDLSSDGSTNYIPIALSPADEAYTLTLTGIACPGGGYCPAGTRGVDYGFVSLESHSASGAQGIDRFYDIPGIRSRRDIVREPQSGLYWIAANDENYYPRKSAFILVDAAGNSTTEWLDPTSGKEVDTLAAAGSGVVYAGSYSSPSTYGAPGLVSVDRYSAPNVKDWTASLSTTAAYTSMDIAATPDGGAILATANPNAELALVMKLAPNGSLDWTVSTSGYGHAWGVLGVAVDGAGTAYVATGVTGTGRVECQVLRISSSGALTVLARWSADPAGSWVNTMEILANGDLLVGGKAGNGPYLAVLSSAGVLKDEWRGLTGQYFGNVMDTAQRSDGKLFVTLYSTSDFSGPVYSQHDALLGMDLNGGGGGVIPGFPTPIPTPTYAPPTLLPTATPTPAPPTATLTPVPPTAVPSDTATPAPTSVPTSSPVDTATTVPTSVPTNTQVDTPTPLPTATETATPVAPQPTATPQPANCLGAVTRVQVVPCPVLSTRGGQLKVQLSGCVPERLHIAVFSPANAVVAEWDVETGLALGWNTLQLPAGLVGAGLHTFKVSAYTGGQRSDGASSCLSLR